MTRSSPSIRQHLLLSVSVTAMILTSTAAPAQAQDTFRRARGGNAAEQAAQAAAARATQNQAASTATQRTIEAFQRASQVRQRMDAAQLAARAAAQAAQASVPNGLGIGGLQVANGVATDPSLWIGANGPTQATGSDGRTKVDIAQTQSKAILTWGSFNVGRETDLTFNQQGNTSWVALNRVTDASADPSKILGSIKADGTVLILNRNGIIFGGASQINTRNLVAAAANITNDQFLGRGIYSDLSGGAYVPSFTDAAGAVTVEAGAQLTTNAPTTATSGGGYVLLMGTSVENAGTITTPKGQTLLAAGDDFLIRPGFGTNANQFSTTRGNEVRGLIADVSDSGAVTNSGVITAIQGDITLTGRTVLQGGVLLSSTSLNQRGTIHLSTSVSDAQGLITFTGGSLTAILPELDSTDTALDSQRDALIVASGPNALATGQFDNLSTLSDRKDQSRVEIASGGDVLFDANSTTLAQGGQVAVSAAHRIQTEAGAILDVSGVRGVALDGGTNAIKVNIQGNDLRDAPVNRDATGKPLYNQDVWIDIRNLLYVPAGTGGYASDRYYTGGGLLEVSGYLGNVGHKIGEWDAIGGTITLSAAEVVARQGSVFNIAGGSIDYTGGGVLSTRLQGIDGKLYDINDAPAGMQFVSVGRSQVVEHKRWGAQYAEVYSNAMFNRGVYVRQEDSYTVGRDGGQLILSAPTVLFDGSIDAETIAGGRQIHARPTNVSDGYKLSQSQAALAGGLQIGRYEDLGLRGGFDTDVRIGSTAPSTSNIDAVTAIAADRIGTAWLDAGHLTGFGLGGLQITSAKAITLDAPLTLTDGGKLTLMAPTIDVNANVTAVGGSVTLTNLIQLRNNQGSTFWSALNPIDGSSQLTVGPNVTLDLRGDWVNQLTDPMAAHGLAHLDGGSLTIDTTGAITVDKGSLIDVSSGGAIRADGTLQGGKGGNVSLLTNDDKNLTDQEFAAADRSAPLVLDGDIRAYGFAGGGTLTVSAPQTIVIGDTPLLVDGKLAAGTAAPISLTLAEPLVIAAGVVLPIDYMGTINVATGKWPPSAAPDFNGLVVASDWMVPSGFQYIFDSNSNIYFAGSTIPAGTELTNSYIGSFTAGDTILADVFPNDIPLLVPVARRYAAGTPAPSDVTFVAGTRVAAGIMLPEDVQVRAPLALSPALFGKGFSSYRVTGEGGMLIEDGVDLASAVPVYRLTGASYVAHSGDLAATAELWLPPAYQKDPVAGLLTKRVGADLTLTTLGDFLLPRTSSINVDPGRDVTLYANGQTTIDGDITAHGGGILVTSVPDSRGRFGSSIGDFSLTRSIWVGENAILDASGIAVSATNIAGHRYGTVLDGGSIVLGEAVGGATVKDGFDYKASDAFVIVRPGAVLDASGSSTTLDLLTGAGPVPTAVASDGGLIGLYSNNGIYNDGSLIAAAGGASVSGGSLQLTLADRFYAPGVPGLTVPEEVQTLRNITLTQSREASGLSADLAPNQGDPFLRFGSAELSAEEIAAGGFDALSLYTSDLFRFKGDITLSLGRSLSLAGGVISAATETPAISVHLNAPYISLKGWAAPDGGNVNRPITYYGGLSGVAGTSFLTAPDSDLTISAALIDIADDTFRVGAFGHQGFGLLSFDVNTGAGVLDVTTDTQLQISGGDIVDAPGFAEVTLVSTGDVRFGTGAFVTGGNLTIQAAQVYPLSGATAAVFANQYLRVNDLGIVNYMPAYRLDGTLKIVGTGTSPELPDSVFGRLSLVGGTIEQAGVLRAPLGVLSFGNNLGQNLSLSDTNVIFRTGSVTSTSAAGLTTPYGGTADGVSYLGGASPSDLAATFVVDPESPFEHVVTGISVTATTMTGEQGAVLDVSGGGDLAGAGFVSGRGGSVDVLKTALVSANPANLYSGSNDRVFAILPGHAAQYAPPAGNDDGGDPAIGQQITLTQSVNGLAAGTYTLLPSRYALLPGGYRVEIGSTLSISVSPVILPDGSGFGAGYLGIANTSIRDSLPTQVVVTPGARVRAFSGYNETDYSDFLRQQATTFSNLRPRLPDDGGLLNLTLNASTTGQGLIFNGTALFDGMGDDAVSGSLFLQSSNPIDIATSSVAPIAGHVTILQDSINAFAADTLVIGGYYAYSAPGSGQPDGVNFFQSRPGPVSVLDGVDLKAGAIFLVGTSINVFGGATLDTTGRDYSGIDSTLGYLFRPGRFFTTAAVLAVGNGTFNFLPSDTSGGTITVADGATLLSEGSIVFAAPGGLTMGNANLSARDLTVALDQINIGTDQSLAAARAAGTLQPGWDLTQGVLDRLLHPAAASGTPALQRLSLTTNGALNLLGDVTLDASGAAGDLELVLNSPAIYGLGAAGETATLRADTLVWNGVRTGSGTTTDPYASLAPAPVTPGGPGSGSGTLAIDARTIVFGADSSSRATDGATLDRTVAGFATVSLAARDRITTSNEGALHVDGALDVRTPLLASAKGGVLDVTATGAVRVTGTPADTAAVSDLGGTFSFTGDSVLFDTAAALPSGKLSLNGTNGVTIGDNARIDLAGRAVTFFDVIKHSWGGDLVLTSDTGNIAQSTAAVIDVSAVNNDAGSITARADAQTVTFAGILKGSANSGFDSGSFTASGQSLGDFADLNAKLADAGFFGTRKFGIGQGDLTIGDEVKAHVVDITLDGGNLTVIGRIDASGTTPGTIRLAARDDLTLGSGAVLDAHASVLQTDTYGAPIEANNTGHIELTTALGTLSLLPGATIDLSSPDQVDRGKIVLNAPRTGETSGDVKVAAQGPFDIRGARSIALNAFWRYTPADADGSVVQDNGGTTPVGADGSVGLNQIDTQSRAFIDAAYHSDVSRGVLVDGLQGKLAGLSSYGDAFHLRPGVEIMSGAASDGKLTVKGDLDLAGYRYGPAADSTLHGSGEPGALVLRAAGDLVVNGSISDGFEAPVSLLVSNLFTSADGSTQFYSLFTDYTVPADGAVISAFSSLSSSGMLNFDLDLTADQPSISVYLSDEPLPVALITDSDLDLRDGVVLTADIILADGVVIPAGTNTSSLADLRVPAGAVLAAGTTTSPFNSSSIQVQSTVWPAGASLAPLGGYFFVTDYQLPAGATLPAGTFVGENGIRESQTAKVAAIAAVLPAGSQSWSLRLAAGADPTSADQRGLKAVSALPGNSGNVILDASGQANGGMAVLRTGSGDLDILAALNYEQRSAYGVYTAGTAVTGTGTAANAAYNLPRATLSDGTVLGGANAGYESSLNAERVYYTEHGGDFLLSVGGDISGNAEASATLIGDWLWRQGGEDIGQSTAWGINFGSYVANSGFSSVAVRLAAFAGLGTLGGGTVALEAGGDIGPSGRGIVVAVGSSGRVLADGTLAQTGGGRLDVKAGGIVGAGSNRISTGGNQFVDIRGDIGIEAGAFGSLVLASYGFNGTAADGEPRIVDPLTAYAADRQVGGSIAVGDGAVMLRTRGDLALGTIDDPGRVGLSQSTAASDGAVSGAGASWFTLWTDGTAIDLFAAGGDVSPLSDQQGISGGNTASTLYLPGTLRVAAPGGSIFLTPNRSGGLMLPTRDGELELLARDNIAEFFQANSPIGPLSTSLSSLATPFRPGWAILETNDANSPRTLATNYWGGTDSSVRDADLVQGAYYYAFSPYSGYFGSGGNPFVFGPNTVTDESAQSSGPTSKIYATNGDILHLGYGDVFVTSSFVNGAQVYDYFYHAAKPANILAGGSIVDLSGMLLHGSATDVSTVAAGKDIFYVGSNSNALGGLIVPGLQIAGPGTLEITAGGNVYEGSSASVESLGALVTGDTRPGAEVVVQAGVGAGAPGVGQVDWTDFANLYLDPANLAGPGPLADQPGKVAKIYDAELHRWLRDRFGYAGAMDDALTYFLASPLEQQRIFLRQVYYAELTAGGREYNNPDSSRYQSYLRGRNAIAALFPNKDIYNGDITLFSSAIGQPGAPNYRIVSGSVHTDFGGGIQFLAPGGGVTVGTEGLLPGANAGLITQGSGDIQIYSKESILLGLSRVFTTFGGNILAWSAEGDINAGRGAKTTVLFTPPRVTYDDYGAIALAPQVPSTGAGIATLNPIPEVPPGDIDLIAPLGTIDAGEAGIRVSGNINLAALHIVNAANIKVQGEATGLPTIAAVNTGALTAASSAASSVSNEAARLAERARPQPIRDIPAIVTVNFIGFGE